MRLLPCRGFAYASLSGALHLKRFKFIEQVARNYAPMSANPYHHFAHAVDVLQTLSVFLKEVEGGAMLSMLDMFAALVAALGHDVGHPGTSNNFLVATRHPLAMTYNDTSVLENMVRTLGYLSSAAHALVAGANLVVCVRAGVSRCPVLAMRSTLRACTRSWARMQARIYSAR